MLDIGLGDAGRGERLAQLGADHQFAVFHLRQLGSQCALLLFIQPKHPDGDLLLAGAQPGEAGGDAVQAAGESGAGILRNERMELDILNLKMEVKSLNYDVCDLKRRLAVV